jgi:hypothetical protein
MQSSTTNYPEWKGPHRPMNQPQGAPAQNNDKLKRAREFAAKTRRYLAATLRKPRTRTALIVILLVLVLFPTWVRERFEEVWENRPWGNEGAIVLETPQLFTRGRLVNDRATESSWLEAQLLKTEDLVKENRFASPDFIKFARQRLALTLNGDGTAKPPIAPEDKEVVRRFADLGLKTQPLDQFEDAVRYRAAIRNALMSTALDDRHDIEGNTIYRFNFNVAVVPPRGTNRLAVVTAELREAEHSEGLKLVYVDILHDWRERLQYQLQRHIDDRVSAIERGHEFAAEENTRFQQWLRDEMSKSGDMPAALVNEFHRHYQRVDQQQQQDQVEWIFRQIPALEAELLQIPEQYREHHLRGVLERCKQTKNFHVSAKVRKAMEPDHLQWLRCPSPQSPLTAGIDLLDVVNLVAAAGSKIDRSCTRPDQKLGLLFYAATPPPPPAKPEQNGKARSSTKFGHKTKPLPPNVSPKDEGPQTSAICKDLGMKLFTERAATGFGKRRNNILAKFVAGTLITEKNPKSNVPLRLSKFFTVVLPLDCETASCIPVVTLNPKPTDLAVDLVNAVKGRANVFTYAVVPNKTVQRTEAAQRSTREVSGVASVLGALPLVGSGSADAEILGVQRDPTVIGFGDSGEERLPGTTKFSWAMFPRAVNGNGSRRHTAENYSVSALVSVPGWWKTAHMTVSTCWVAESELKNGVSCKKSADKQPQQFTVRLPGDASDLMQNLRFEVVTYPFVDRVQPEQSSLEVGRAGSVVIRGGRLWRSPIVRLGAQQADRIEVLPDMLGIIARFDCIAPEPGTRGDRIRPADQPEVKLSELSNTEVLPRSVQVFTSEGQTQPMPVTVRPFTARAGYNMSGLTLQAAAGGTDDTQRQNDEPCWMKMEKEAREEKERKNFLLDEEIRKVAQAKAAAATKK